jgi:hypothetical protein
MSGYQFRRQALEMATDSWIRNAYQIGVLNDRHQYYDEYLVKDELPVGGPEWKTPLFRLPVLWRLLQNDWHNLPASLKYFTILLTPGGLLALLFSTITLTRERTLRAEAQLAWIATISAVILMLAYGMVLVSERYFLPIVPVLMAVAVPYLLPSDKPPKPFPASWRYLPMTLALLSTLVFLVIPSSAFRTRTRDYQTSSYDAANKLRSFGRGETLVVIGGAPYNDHGMGAEAGIFAAYFAGWKIVADLGKPWSTPTEEIVNSIRQASPDAAMIWGLPRDPHYGATVKGLQSGSFRKSMPILDEKDGEVGTIVFLH